MTHTLPWASIKPQTRAPFNSRLRACRGVILISPYLPSGKVFKVHFCTLLAGMDPEDAGGLRCLGTAPTSELWMAGLKERGESTLHLGIFRGHPNYANQGHHSFPPFASEHPDSELRLIM